MTAQRKTPDSTNSPEPYDASQYKRDVNQEVIELWKRVVYRINSVGGTGNVITGSIAVANEIAAAQDYNGLFIFRPIAVNGAGGVTISLDGLGSVSLLDFDGLALAPGALVIGRSFLFGFDGANLRIINGSGLVSPTNIAAADIILQDQKTSNTVAGASLSISQITLPAGTYAFEWSAPASQVNAHQTRLFNVTDSSVPSGGVGTSESSSAGVATTSRSSGYTVVTITSSKAFEIDHNFQTTAATNGQGIPANLGLVEVYAWMKIWKIA
jgi:hypothetical protein